MELKTWLTYFITALILTATPGPSIFLGIVHSINYGVKKTIYTALGDICANFLQMLLVAMGLGVVIAHSETAFHVIKWFGVLTLFYMGVKILLSSADSFVQGSDNENFSEKSAPRLFFAGFMVAAGNPKAIVFFTAFFPQFIEPNQPLIPQLAIMCPTMSILDFSMVMIYAAFASKLVRSGKTGFPIIHKLSGTILIGAAELLAKSQQQ